MFRFCCPSPAGGLPLGLIICSSESEEVLTAALTAFKEILPDNAFFKRGKDVGPSLFMTDDCESEINSIR